MSDEDVWRLNEAEALAHCVALGRRMEPDHAGHWRYTCAVRACGRAVVNAGGGYYGSATERLCVPGDTP